MKVGLDKSTPVGSTQSRWKNNAVNVGLYNSKIKINGLFLEPQQ